MTLKELINIFIDAEARPEEIREPVLLRRYTAYTDRNTVLYVPLSGEYVEKLGKVATKLTEQLSIAEVDNTITISDLEDAISHYVKHEEIKYSDCLVCNGSSYVDVDFELKGKLYNGIEIQCPECDGSGKGDAISIKMKYQDYDDSINLDGVFLNANFIERLILVAKFNNKNEVKMLTKPHTSNPTLFKCGDMLVLIMPMINQEGVKPFVKVTA